MTSKLPRPLARRSRRDEDPHRPHVSNDNPFSEAQFKTLKYRPTFPARFGSIQDARMHCHAFFIWYNTEHHHLSLGLLTPADVHHGLAQERVAARTAVLARAYAAHPERFLCGAPHPPARPVEVWINPPQTRVTEEASGLAAPRGGVLDHPRPEALLSRYRPTFATSECPTAPA